MMFKKYLNHQQPKKVIVVKGRIVNIVVLEFADLIIRHLV